MNVRYCVGLLALIISPSNLAAESFYVFAPNKAQKKLMRVAVHETTDGIGIEQLESLSLPLAPASIAVDHDQERLVVSAGGKDQPPVATIEILSGGELRVLYSSTLQHPSGYSSVDRTGKFILTANYVSGKVTVYPIDAKGSIGRATCSLTTPNKEAHCILTTRDNRFVYIPCVKNNNALFQYAFDDKTGELKPLTPFDAEPPAMFGPRHIAYHPTLPIAYFSNEQQLGVSLFRIGSDGQLSDIQHAVTMPRRSPFEQGKRDLHASDLVVTNDGIRLFVAVRDFNGDEDSVFSFRIEADGTLSLIARTKVGDIPWKLDLSPNGKFLLVSESFDQRLAIYEIQGDGKLTAAANVDWNAEVRDMVVIASPPNTR